MGACGIARDTETTAWIQSVAGHMSAFSFYFGLVLGEMLSRHSDNLNKTLQHDKLLAAEGQAIAVMITTTLLSLRNDAHYHLLWQKVIAMAKGNNVKDSKLPRNRKRPIRHEDCNAAARFCSTAEFHSSSIPLGLLPNLL